jgi:hypothetical protein
MKIVVFSSHVLLTPHYETELELMLEHQAAGDEIIQLVCDSDLPACDTNPYFHPEVCSKCISKRQMGLKLLPKPIVSKRFYKLTDADRLKIRESIRKFESIDELKKFKVDGFDIGYAIASSLISYYRDPSPVLLQEKVNRYLAGVLGVYFSMLNYLRENHTDRVYVFNGRLAHTKAALRACQSLGVECFLHERGSSNKSYALFKNKSIHDLTSTRSLIHKTWMDANPQDREKKAEDFYNARATGKQTNWIVFNKNQEDQLPSNWDFSKRNIVIFNTSEDELAAISDEWKNPLYANQLDGIKSIIKDASLMDNIHIYLRIHPNLKNVKTSETEALRSLSGANFTLIPPESSLSSYFLLNHANSVITFGSTLGMEACFWGKPSILAGIAIYRTLGSTYDPSSHAELMDLLNRDLPPLSKEAAFKFGYFFGNFGIPFKYYVPEDFANGLFLGKRVKPLNSFDFKVNRAIFQNKYFPSLSEKLRLYYRERVLKKYM